MIDNPRMIWSNKNMMKQWDNLMKIDDIYIYIYTYTDNDESNNV